MGKGKKFPIKRNCPCLDLIATEICFKTFIRGMFCKTNPDDSDVEEIKPSEVYFCKDSKNILSGDYGVELRKISGTDSFAKIETYEQLVAVLESCYWYSNYSKRRRLEKKGVFDTVKRNVKQAIYFTNGIIVKHFLIVREFDYTDLALESARCFWAIYDELSQPVPIGDGGTPKELPKDESIFKNVKEAMNHFKERFNHEELKIRREACVFDFSPIQGVNLFAQVLYTLKNRAANIQFRKGTDYTLTPQWKLDGALLTQTRSLCYLPDAISVAKAFEFRQTLAREQVRISQDHYDLIGKSVQTHLELARVPKGLFSSLGLDTWNKLIEEIESEVEFDVKLAASYNTPLHMGGKLEDVRRLYNLARVYHWKIPVYDLHNHKLLYEFDVFEKEQISYSKFIFWLSYQLAMNFTNRELRKLAEKTKQELKPGIFYPEKKFEGFDDSQFNYARILHIKEPGKQRNLIKSTTEYNSFLALGGKICQILLGLVREHEVGLRSSSDAWKFYQRIHPNVEGQPFFEELYRPMIGTQINAKRMYAYYTDWTESTDFIERDIGITSLRAFMSYICFPSAYGELIRKVLFLPQEVKEVYKTYDNFWEPVEYSGYIRNGFMMGNPITKTILHLQHSVELGGTYIELRKRKVILRHTDLGRPPDKERWTIAFMQYINSRSNNTT